MDAIEFHRLLLLLILQYPQLYSAFLFIYLFLLKPDTLQPAHSVVIPDLDHIRHTLFTFIAAIIFFIGRSGLIVGRIELI